MKEYRILIHGCDNYEKLFKDIINVEAESLKKAIAIAGDTNGVYEAEPAEEYDEYENYGEE